MLLLSASASLLDFEAQRFLFQKFSASREKPILDQIFHRSVLSPDNDMYTPSTSPTIHGLTHFFLYEETCTVLQIVLRTILQQHLLDPLLDHECLSLAIT